MEGVKGPLAYYVRSSQYKCETICMIYNKFYGSQEKVVIYSLEIKITVFQAFLPYLCRLKRLYYPLLSAKTKFYESFPANARTTKSRVFSLAIRDNMCINSLSVTNYAVINVIKGLTRSNYTLFFYKMIGKSHAQAMHTLFFI